jgi:hypothetical protein
VSDYLCNERHRTLDKNIYELYHQSTVVGHADHKNVVSTMKTVYPLALEFAEARLRRFEREARAERGLVGHKLAAAERQRDLQSESRLLLECSHLCDLAIFGKDATESYEDAREMETELARAGLIGDPLLARSRMSAWKTARKKARKIKWVDGKPSVVATGGIRITGGRGQQARGGAKDGRVGTGGGGAKNKKGKKCHKCGAKDHMSFNCPHAKPQPGSYWAKNPQGSKAKKKK